MKKLFFTALVVAVFGFYFFSEAAAQCDPFDPDCFSWDFFCPSCTMGNTTGSSVDCTFASGGGINTINTTNNAGTVTKTFTQIGQAHCTHQPDNIDLGICDFNLSMSGVTLTGTGCEANGTGECDATASCLGTDPTVTGQLTCVNSVLYFGLSKMNDNQCTSNFPAGVLAAGQLLHAHFTRDANGFFQTIAPTNVRGCNSDNPNVDCTLGGVDRLSQGTSDSAVSFEFNVRQTVNTSPSFCKKVSIDKGQATLDFFGSGLFTPANILVTSLTCNGQTGVTCSDSLTDLNGDGFLDRTCQIPTCPTLGPALGQLPKNPDGTVTMTCTGQLTSGQKILGFDESVNTSPSK